MPLPPILCAPLLRKVDSLLLQLLRSLDATEWDTATAVPGWAVRDVAAHLLDTASRKLSLARDACFVEKAAIRSAQDVVDLVNRLNREGVVVYRRLSPPVLCDWMAMVCEQSADYHEQLNPFGPALFPVSWAGEASSLQWFDTARELTERWHHQQQIREAVNRPGIMTPELYHPVLDTFLRGLPYRYRDVVAEDGTVVRVEVTGGCGGIWECTCQSGSWKLQQPGTEDCAASVSIPQEVAWKLFTKGLTQDAARQAVTLEGEARLAQPVLDYTAIVG